MGIKIQTQSSQVSSGVAVLTFTFDDRIDSYVYGISSFTVNYGTCDDPEPYELQRVAISIDPNMSGDDSLKLTCTATMTDADGDNVGCFSISVTVVAWLGEQDSAQGNVLLSVVKGVDTKGAPVPFDPSLGFPDQGRTIAFISGFDMQLAESEDFTSVAVSAGSSFNTSGIEVTGTAALGSGTQTVGTVDIGVVGFYSTVPTGLTLLSQLPGQGGTTSVTFPSAVSQVALMLQQTSAAYDDDYEIAQWMTYTTNAGGDGQAVGGAVSPPAAKVGFDFGCLVFRPGKGLKPERYSDQQSMTLACIGSTVS